MYGKHPKTKFAAFPLKKKQETHQWVGEITQGIPLDLKFCFIAGHVNVAQTTCTLSDMLFGFMLLITSQGVPNQILNTSWS